MVKNRKQNNGKYKICANYLPIFRSNKDGMC